MKLKFQLRPPARLLLGAALLGGVPTAQADIKFFDGTFAASGWAVVTFTAGLGGTASTISLGSGGNPGAYLQITLHVNSAPTPGGNDRSTIIGCVFNNGAVYNPQFSGPTLGIEYAEDIEVDTLQAFGPALLQNGNVYLYEVGAAGGPWGSSGPLSLQASAFYLMGPGAIPDTATHPDFSGSGAPITFGFWRGNSTGLGGPAYTTVGGIDNWTVTVGSSASAAGPPLALALAGTNVVVSWPSSATGFSLQYSSSLAPAGWLPVATAPAVVNDRNVVTNALSGTQMFFRLGPQ